MADEAKLTQVGLTVVGTGNPAGKVTQMGLTVVGTGNPAGKLTQVGLTVVYRAVTVVAGGYAMVIDG